MAEAQGGFLHMLPVYLPEGMTTTAVSNAMLPWISPSYSGVVGATLDNPRNRS